MKIKIFVGFWILSIGSSFSAQASVISAGSCSQYDVQAALNSASDGDTVMIPAGTCHWNTTLVFTVPGALTIMGAGSQSVIGGDDKTIIIDDVPRSITPYVDPNTFYVNTVEGKPFRISAVTFQGGNNGVKAFNEVLFIAGKSKQVRVDHVHFNLLNDKGVGFGDWEYGVIDHCLFDEVLGTLINGIVVNHSGWNNLDNGNGSWNDEPYLGTEKAIFIEDNVFHDGFVNDAGEGAHIVLRNNMIHRSYFQVHNGGAPIRGARTFEVYGNTFDWHSTNLSTDQAPFAMFIRSGTGLIWGNTVTNGYDSIFTIYFDHADTVRGDQGWGLCDGKNPWDQNSDSYGYACLDQIGRGKGDLLTGNPPINSLTGTISWPHQAYEPMYEWNDAFTNVGQMVLTGIGGSQFPNVIKPNRDFYISTPTFDGSAGVGSGLLAERPLTCISGVAFWASDVNTLYQCGSPNSWTAYYTPYTYPHPLTQSVPSSGDVIPPSAILTAPVTSTNMSGAIAISATASDNVAVLSVQFLLDGIILGSPVLAPPYTVSLNSYSVSNGTHSISAVATDSSGNRGFSASAVVTVNNATIPNLAGYWPFDEGVGSIARDYSGHGNAGTLSNIPTWILGRTNQAISFNGINQLMQSLTGDLSQTNAVSVAFWMNAPLNDDNNAHSIFDTGFGVKNTGFGAIFNSSWWGSCGPAQLSALQFGNATFNIKCFTSPSPNSWHHYAFIFDNSQSAADELNLYIDGILQTATLQPSANLNTNNFANNGFSLMSNFVGSSQFMQGMIDDLRVYSKALSAADVQALYKYSNGGALLTVGKTGSGSGIVTSVPAGINCGSACLATISTGTTVSLIATANSGSIFTGWSGDCSGTDSCLLTMNNNTSVTATFSQPHPADSATIQFLPFVNVLNTTKSQVMIIKYQSNSNPVQLTIYDRAGTEVRSLTNAGLSSAAWDGRNDSGQVVTSEVYTIILKANGTVLKKKIVVVK